MCLEKDIEGADLFYTMKVHRERPSLETSNFLVVKWKRKTLFFDLVSALKHFVM